MKQFHDMQLKLLREDKIVQDYMTELSKCKSGGFVQLSICPAQGQADAEGEASVRAGERAEASFGFEDAGAIVVQDEDADEVDSE